MLPKHIHAARPPHVLLCTQAENPRETKSLNPQSSFCLPFLLSKYLQSLPEVPKDLRWTVSLGFLTCDHRKHFWIHF